jgi:hypothetical protein
LKIEKQNNSIVVVRADSINNKYQFLRSKYQALSEEMDAFKPLSERTEKVIEEIRYEYAPRYSVMFALNHPDCQSIFSSMFKYCPQISSNQIEYIYSNAGKNLRRCGRKLNINDYESLYSFIVSANLDPENVTADEIRKMLRQLIDSGDLKRAAIKIFDASNDTYERAIAVIKSTYRLS